MNKEKWGKVGKILLWTLAILVILFLISIAYLFLYSKGEIFGIVYESDKSNKIYIAEKYTQDELNNIYVTTDKYDIGVVVSDDEEVRVYAKNDMNGFMLKKNSKSYVEAVYTASAQSLSIKTHEMHGWVSAGNSNIVVSIPRALIDDDILVSLTTAGSSDINFNGDGETFNTVELNLDRGDAKFGNMAAQVFNINAKNALVSADKSTFGVTQTMNISAGNSTINLREAGDSAKVLKDDPEGYDKIGFDIDKLNILSSNSKAVLYVTQAHELLSEKDSVISGGEVQIKKVGFVNFHSDDFSILTEHVTDLNGDIKYGGSIFTADGLGSFYSKESDGVLNVTTNSGSITILKALDSLVLESNSGDISVAEANKELSLRTDSGNARVQFNSELGNYELATGVRFVSSLWTKNGNVEIDGVDRVNAEIENGGSGRIFLNYHKVVDVSEIKPYTGRFEARLPDDEYVKISVKSQGATVQIDVGTLTYPKSVLNGEYKNEVFGAPQGNELNVVDATIGGSVRLWDSRLG